MTMAELTQPDFPILRRIVNGRPLVFLDSAASSQKPTVVLEAMTRYYEQSHANVHRSIHTLGEEATELYEGARDAVRAFISAASREEMIFTHGTTEGVNLMAQAVGRTLKPGDEILVTEMEHHSNLIPWQMACRDSGARLVAVPVLDGAHLDMASFDRLLSPRTRVAAFAHVSNVLGTINPVAEMTRRAHAAGALVLVDGAQSAPHLPVNVRELGCDFFAFSGHKTLGPTGVGVLYGRESLLERMPPYQGGGDMIATVSIQHSTWAPLPAKFEAGTPMIAEVMGLGAALDYIGAIGLDPIGAWERELLDYATERVSEIEGVRLIGTARDKASVLGFLLEGAHPHDIGTILDDFGVAIRAGHHCAQPVMERFGVPATARASFAFYNTKAEIDTLADGLLTVKKMFAR